ncbi:hypothetical protein FRC08_001313 [Ceratobasidium sp. 394]|nr:hypothetical protein FRC08_001313 [Ceratobasidium sp. 394]
MYLAHSVGSGLLGSFNRGALSFKPKAILVGNSYPKMSWTEASYLTGKYDFELLTINDDLERMKKWIGFVPGKPSVSVEHDADEATIKSVFENCHTVSTLLYMNGHVVFTDQGERIYYPADCSAPGCSWPMSGIPLTASTRFNPKWPVQQLKRYAPQDMGGWLTDTEELVKLVVVTDFCYCTNFVGEWLPYVAEKIDGVWVWEETGKNSDPSLWDDKQILHFASTNEDEQAHAFKSSAGLYTRDFYNVSPYAKITLGGRLDKIQDGMECFFGKYAKQRREEPLQQHHRLYSSHKLDFNDTNVFGTMGLSVPK